MKKAILAFVVTLAFVACFVFAQQQNPHPATSPSNRIEYAEFVYAQNIDAVQRCLFRSPTEKIFADTFRQLYAKLGGQGGKDERIDVLNLLSQQGWEFAAQNTGRSEYYPGETVIVVLLKRSSH
ncbi:MAG TPA: hypothetical protein VIM11_06640 [Tepidisphaeraceae bacterium]|jgi:hypothetical protein